ncbi:MULTISPECIES: DMT family transporter [Exiguobacterium]|uniref:DMT family transporter n=1 Tax=Exiguobacterium TaxID=33986 RepID=UPI0008779AB5|nr:MULTISPECIES: EamA family transporter [Exiguobacterium]TCI36501.1 EamA family transporter [Exiguobacterium sp. SH4S7]TCI48552.1 EamA family transporter [Exiguobacterium sp. SH5S32]TCI55438.1 EamA family transporter [Exiguobacterium sp. SH1S4]TCI63451.1 EamA family transporter [Exiguobacterium sp. SH0S2]TCI75233.1 EamA family transporter [Exiguobacterium sp. SH1S1]
MRKEWLGAISLALAASIWGGMYVVSKYALGFIEPFTLVWMRYAVAFIVLFAAWSLFGREQVRREDLKWITLVGVIGYVASISFQFIGTKLSDAHTGSLVTAATPAFMVLFARLILKEQLTPVKIGSLVLATLGVIIVVGWHVDGTYLLGSLVLVGAAITWALMSVYVKVASQTVSSLTITTFAIGIAFVLMTPLMGLEVVQSGVPDMTSVLWLSVLYVGIISTAGAFFFWNKGLELMDASVGSLFFFFQPLVGGYLGWLVLGEQLDRNFFIGAACIVTAVTWSTLVERRQKRRLDVTASYERNIL